jgi:hypothetical protein
MAKKTPFEKEQDRFLIALANRSKVGGQILDEDLARELGYGNEPEKFMEIVSRLMQQGLVGTRRLDIAGKNPLEIWPTPQGLKRGEEAEQRYIARISLAFRALLKAIPGVGPAIDALIFGKNKN